jgi:hypothetical protein
VRTPGDASRAEQVALVLASVRPPRQRRRRGDEDDRAEDHEAARDEQGDGRRGHDHDRRGEQRAGDEDHLDGDAVERIGGGQQLRLVAQ